MSGGQVSSVKFNTWHGLCVHNLTNLTRLRYWIPVWQSLSQPRLQTTSVDFMPSWPPPPSVKRSLTWKLSFFGELLTDWPQLKKTIQVMGLCFLFFYFFAVVLFWGDIFKNPAYLAGGLSGPWTSANPQALTPGGHQDFEAGFNALRQNLWRFSVGDAFLPVLCTIIVSCFRAFVCSVFVTHAGETRKFSARRPLF